MLSPSVNTANQCGWWSSPNILTNEPDKSCTISSNLNFLLFNLFHLYGRQLICSVVLVLHLFSVCHAPFCDPKGWFKSSALLEAVKFLKLKFLNSLVARNQPHSVFLQLACTAMLWHYLSCVWGPHGGTFACSQLCILNHFCCRCCCRELRGMCLGYRKASGLPCSMWEFTKADILKRGEKKKNNPFPVATSWWKYLVGLWKQPCRSTFSQRTRARGLRC